MTRLGVIQGAHIGTFMGLAGLGDLIDQHSDALNVAADPDEFYFGVVRCEIVH
jgi:hypothetical protein